MRAPPQPPGAQLPLSAPPPPRWMFVVGGASLVCFIFYCYWPLTRYFFSQDDFYFLEKASFGFRAVMEQHFTLRPGHFRPLTKGLYFLATWPLFGLHALPYHVVSIALHAVNSILAGVLLRRLGVSNLMSWIAALLFAANTANLEAVAWISCVQQLLSTTFALVALIWGVDALAQRSRKAVIAAGIAYLLALASYEQTLAVPLVLIVWEWSRRGARSALRACRGPLFPMLVLFVMYCVYVLGARGLPRAGPYEMWIGHNVLDNFLQYSGSVFAIWLLYPYLDLPVGLRGSHIVWCALIAWYMITKRPRQLVFGVSAFLLFLAPVLFIHYHVFSFHLYLPAIGASYLAAGAADALVELLRGSWQRSVRVVAMCAVVVAAAGSTVALRKNLVNYCSDDVKIPKVRVLRRAVLADQVCADVQQRWQGGPRLVLVYAGDPAWGNWGNIKSALSEGTALRLILHRPDLAVDLLLPEQVSGIPARQIMVVTELGQTFTVAEYDAIRVRHPTWRGPVTSATNER